jgi:soluble lytic murein transglycosylase-like protein
MGVMQLIPDTAARFKVQDIFNPEQNIRGGLAYLRWLLAYFEGDVVLAAAAYNAGEGAVERHRGVPPFRETRAYVKRIMAFVQDPDHPYDSRIVRPSAALSAVRASRVAEAGS